MLSANVRKPKVFLTFTGGIEMEHWAKKGHKFSRAFHGKPFVPSILSRHLLVQIHGNTRRMYEIYYIS